MMNPIPHYKYFKPHRVDILPADNLSYSTNRYGEDSEIRYGFGRCSKLDRSHIEVAEVDLAWLGVIFHIVKTSVCEDGWWGKITAVQDDLEAMKGISREMVLAYFHQHPQRQYRLLEAVYEGGRTEGRLELALGTVRLLDPSMDIIRR